MAQIKIGINVSDVSAVWYSVQLALRLTSTM